MVMLGINDIHGKNESHRPSLDLQWSERSAAETLSTISAACGRTGTKSQSSKERENRTSAAVKILKTTLK